MRDTFEWIDGATQKDYRLRHALYDLAAQQLAAQSAALIFARWGNADEDIARKTIEEVAGYPGITSRTMTEESKTRVGERATQILIRLLKMRASFFRE